MFSFNVIKKIFGLTVVFGRGKLLNMGILMSTGKRVWDDQPYFRLVIHSDRKSGLYRELNIKVGSPTRIEFINFGTGRFISIGPTCFKFRIKKVVHA